MLCKRGLSQLEEAKLLVQIEGYQRESHSQYFDKMFQQRKAVFFDQKKWAVKITADLYEID